MSTEKTMITIEATINASIDKVWKAWTNSEDIGQWCFASPDWHMPSVNQDFKEGGTFCNRMEAKDGSFGFDFEGRFEAINEKENINIILGDGRVWNTTFESNGEVTKVIESFEAEAQNPVEMQEAGWQAILNNFKKYAERKNLEKLIFTSNINAPVTKVYEIMLAPDTYNEWTSMFNPTSNYEGSWEKGSKILFVGTGENGEKGGMVSKIKENIPNEYVSIEHIGVLKGDEEITSGPEVEGWSGSHENYIFTPKEDGTQLTVELDAMQEYRSYFEETYPKALNKLKEICER